MRRFLFCLLLIWPVLIRPVAGLAQTDDKGVLVNMLQSSLSGAGREVVIDGFSGALSSRATLDKLTIADATGIWLTLTGVTLDWNRAALFKGRVDVTQLRAASILLTRLPVSEPSLPSPEATAFSLPELPVSVNIAALQATKIVLGKDVLGVPLQATLSGALSLSDGQGNAALSVNRTDSIKGQFALNAGYENTNQQLDLDLSMIEGANGLVTTLLGLPGHPSLSLTIKGSGPIQDIETRIALATDGVPRMRGTVATETQKTLDDNGAENGNIRRIRVDLDGDLAPLFAPDYRAFFGKKTALTSVLNRMPDGSTRLDHLLFTAASMQIAGDLALDPNGLPERFALDIAVADPSGGPVRLPVPGVARINSAAIQAHFDADKGDTWAMTGHIAGLVQPDLTFANVALDGSGTVTQTAPRGITSAITARATGITATDPQNAATAMAIGPTMTATARTSWQEGAPFDIETLRLDTKDSSISASAKISGPLSAPVIAATLDASLTNLAGLRPIANRPLSGALHTTLSGTLWPMSNSFDMTLAATGSALKVGQPQIDTLTSGTTRIDISAKRDFQGLAIRRMTIKSDAIDAAGSAHLRTRQSDYDLALSLDNLARFVPEISGPVSIKSAGTETDIGWDATLTATAPGRTTVTATAKTRNDLIQTQISAITRTLSGLLPDLTGSSQITATLNQNENGWSYDAKGTGPSGTTLNTAGTLSADFARADLTAKGAFPLAALNSFLRPNAIGGTALYDLGLKGPLTLGAMTGTIETSDARLSLPDLQTALSGIKALIRLNDNTAALTAKADVAAGGTLDLSGQTSLVAPYSADITTALHDVSMRYESLVETVLNGNLRINGPLTGGALISGALTLDPTEVRVSTASGGSGTNIKVTHLNEPAQVRQTRGFAGLIDAGNGGTAGPPFSLDLTLKAPDRFFVRGLGLNSEFNGELHLGGTTDAPITAGEFALVRGRLDFLAKRFDLTDGLVTLQGDFVPELRLVASTQTNDASFDIILEGSADAPDMSVDSSPDMPQDEALAQLLFGKDASEMSAFQAVQLANAVASLAGRGTGNLLGQLRDNLGVDDLDVTTDDQGQAGVAAGKYINKNIYSEIGIDGAGKSNISLNLNVTPNLTVKGQVKSDSNNGIGLFFERDY